MTLRDVLAQGPLQPPREPNPVGAEELAGGWVVFSARDCVGQWIVVDDQHVYPLEAME